MARNNLSLGVDARDRTGARASVLTVVSVVLLVLSFVPGLGSGDIVAGDPASWLPILLIVLGRGLYLLFRQRP
jgi:hypothetical protein